MASDRSTSHLGELFGWLRRVRPWVFHHVDYRWPLSAAETSFDPRRGDLALGYLLEAGLITREDVREPTPAPYDALERVHAPAYLESLTRAEGLAPTFGATPQEIEVDEVMRTVRLAVGGTVEGAKLALSTRRPVLNLLGGFHHAGRGFGSGFCPVNDVAVAIAELRAGGFSGRVAVLDLDAHPPDGTADCLKDDAAVFIASMSGPHWPTPPGIDETVLPDGCADRGYLEALERLLSRLPACELAFVLAGGDVLAGDTFGRLGLTLEGARRRDLRVARRLAKVPAVWLPAGGYSKKAWRVLTGTGCVLAGRPRHRIPAGADPLRAHLARVAAALPPEQLGEPLLTEEDLGLGGSRASAAPRLLGFYSREGIELALQRVGLWRHVERLGYRPLRVELDADGAGDRLRVFGRRDGGDHLLVEMVLTRRTVAGREVLFVNWLTLRDPLAAFSAARPQLPGQSVPGLGLAREAVELLGLMARRLSLAGVAFRPSWFHMAYATRHEGRFVDPERQRRFEQLLRDTRGTPLLEATHAIAEGRVQLDGAPYRWEAEDMVTWLLPEPTRRAADPGGPRRFTLDGVPVVEGPARKG